MARRARPGRGRAHPILHPARRQHRPRPRPGKGVPLAVRPDPRPRPRGGLLADRAHRQAGPPRGEPPHGAGFGDTHPGDRRRQPRAVCLDLRPPAGHHPPRRAAGGGLRDRGRRPGARVGRAQEPGRPRLHPDHRQDALPARRPLLPAHRGRRRRGPILRRLQARPRPPRRLADALGECQARFPTVPIIFCETRALAQEWTYRFLSAALAHADEETHVETEATPLTSARAASPGEVRQWARKHGYAVSDPGRIPREIREAFEARR
nr:histone-like nucleoid-structuring protein Lsr2 [Serinicoccus marinus]